MKMVMVGRGGGRIAVAAGGAGPLVVCVPGMGESRASFRHLVPGLVAAGYRVAVMDLRGHGDSSVRFDAYDDPAAAGDVLAVIDALGGGSATIVGNSMGAAAAVLAAAERPPTVDRLVLIGPFVRDHGSALTRWLMRVLLARPWGPAVWRTYYGSLSGNDGPPTKTSMWIGRSRCCGVRAGGLRSRQRRGRLTHQRRPRCRG